MRAWHPPIELQTPLPRKVRLTSRAKREIWKFLARGLLPPVLVAWLLVPVVGTQIALKWHGVDASGQVLRLSSGTSRRHAFFHHVTYSYEPAWTATGDRGERRGEADVTESAYRALRPGDPLPVLYDPRDPDRSLPNLRDEVRTTSLAGILATPLFLAFLTALLVVKFTPVRIFRRIRRERQLLASGTAAQATILDEEADWDSATGKACARVRYRFTDASGTTMQGTRTSLPLVNSAREDERLCRARVLDNPTVLYAPRDSTRCTLYPPLYAKIVRQD